MLCLMIARLFHVLGSNDNSCGDLSSVTIRNASQGTNLLIAVLGASMDDAGEFIVVARESIICNPEGPEYECETSYTLSTDQKCGNNEQCATIPSPVELGFCYDSGVDCECTIRQISGVQGGEILPAGIYEVVSVAENDAGFASDECSFRVNIENTCNPQGPTIRCVDDPIRLRTRSCESANGNPCGIMPPAMLAACQDFNECACTTEQVSGPVPGDKLEIGTYTIEMSATNSAQYSSTCTVPVIVE